MRTLPFEHNPLEAIRPKSERREGARRDEFVAQHFDSSWFTEFVETHFEAKHKRSNDPAPYEFMEWQEDAFEELLELDDEGQLVASTIMLNWPRRYGKSEDAAYYDLVRCLAYANQLVVIQGNSDDQASETAFRWIIKTIVWSVSTFGARSLGANRYKAQFVPKNKTRFADMPPIDIDIVDGEIRFSNGSLIQVMPCNEASTYGRAISVYHNTELCKAQNTDVFQAGASSTGDSWCGVTIVDSNMGAKDELVDQLTEQGLLAKATNGRDGDPATKVSYITHDSIEDAVASGMAPWLSEAWLRSRQRAMTTGEFRRNHLNKALGAGNPAFGEELIRAAQSLRAWISDQICGTIDQSTLSVWTPRNRFRALRKKFVGHALRTGIGLDRSLGTTRGDRTVLTVWACGVLEDLQGKTVVVFDDDGEEIDVAEADPRVLFPLAIVFVPGSTPGAIKRAIRRAQKLYGDPSGIAMEMYQARDLSQWAEEEGYDNVSLEALTDGRRASMAQGMSAILAEKRVALPSVPLAAAHVFIQELTRYEEVGTQGRYPKYEGRKARVLVHTNQHEREQIAIKDDCVESSFWAMDPLVALDPDDDGGMYV